MTASHALAALALLGAPSAQAQPATTFPVPVEPRIEAPFEPRPIELVQRPEINARRAAADADARACLELATNMDVHRCADRYRARTARR
jgi:hypothetical protein